MSLVKEIPIMHQWFKYLFDERKDKDGFVKCFECGRSLHENVYKDITTCYSHILAKSLYPQHAGNEENIEIVHPDCHNLYTMKPKQAKNQYNKYLELKKIYNL